MGYLDWRDLVGLLLVAGPVFSFISIGGIFFSAADGFLHARTA